MLYIKEKGIKRRNKAAQVMNKQKSLKSCYKRTESLSRSHVVRKLWTRSQSSAEETAFLLWVKLASVSTDRICYLNSVFRTEFVKTWLIFQSLSLNPSALTLVCPWSRTCSGEFSDGESESVDSRVDNCHLNDAGGDAVQRYEGLTWCQLSINSSCWRLTHLLTVTECIYTFVFECVRKWVCFSG